MRLFRKILIIGICGAIFYFILAYHFIVIHKSIKLLPKDKLTLKYTFFSTEGRTPKNILDIDDLWNAGIADLLVEEKLMTKEELDEYVKQHENAD